MMIDLLIKLSKQFFNISPLPVKYATNIIKVWHLVLILFLLKTPLVCYGQIIDKSEDVSHTNYKVKLPSTQYSEEDFSLLTNYAFTTAYRKRQGYFMRKKNMLDIHYAGNGFKGYHERKIDLSNQKIILRRYAFFEIDVIADLTFGYKFDETKKIAIDGSSKIFNILKDEFNIESIDLNETNFVEFNEFSLISDNILEDNLGSYDPIKFSYNNFLKYKRKYEEIGKVLNKTLTDEIELFPIYVLYNLGDYFVIYMDIYFSKQNEEIYNETFMIHFENIDISEQLVWMMLRKSLKKVNESIGR